MTTRHDNKQAAQTNHSPEVARLYWQCRRGMLELDLLLQDFMKQTWPALDDIHRQAFETLLQSPDQLLYDYLLGDTIPFDKDVAYVVEQIRLTPHI